MKPVSYRWIHEITEKEFKAVLQDLLQEYKEYYRKIILSNITRFTTRIQIYFYRKINWSNITRFTTIILVQRIFTEKVGNYQATFKLKEKTVSIFLKPRLVPITIFLLPFATILLKWKIIVGRLVISSLLTFMANTKLHGVLLMLQWRWLCIRAK